MIFMSQYFMHACAVWYDNISASLKNKFRSLHYRLLRTACRDYYFEYSLDYLARRCQRANPDEWSHFCSANIVLKTLGDKYPSQASLTVTSRNLEMGGLGNFFDKLKTKVGKQLIQHRLAIISEKLFSLGMMLNCPMIQLEFYLKKLTFLIVNNFFIILWSLALIPHILF